MFQGVSGPEANLYIHFLKQSYIIYIVSLAVSSGKHHVISLTNILSSHATILCQFTSNEFILCSLFIYFKDTCDLCEVIFTLPIKLKQKPF
jgi:ABC-type polysaccharide/polyol phosphate export permease